MAGKLGDMDYLWYSPATDGDWAMRLCPACTDERCISCAGLGYDPDDMGQACEDCDGTGVCPMCDGDGEIEATEPEYEL